MKNLMSLEQGYPTLKRALALIHQLIVFSTIFKSTYIELYV